jgi:DNA adenine methylase
VLPGAAFLLEDTMTTNPLKWHGGKQYLADWVLSLAPEHTHYVEPYFGGGAVLLAREPGGSEYVNDLNTNLAEFWECLRNPTLYSELQRMLDMTPMSEEMFVECQGIIESPDTRISPVTRAWAFFVVARQSRQALMKDFATMSRTRTRRGINEQASSWLSAVDGLAEVHARLQSVVITNKPALEVIRQQDGHETWFYVDPPYLHTTRQTTKDYQHEMSEQDHRDLLSLLASISGKFSLSGYPSDLYSEYARIHGWRCEVKEIDNKASSKATKDIKQECLWMNY